MLLATLFMLFPLWKHYRSGVDSTGGLRQEFNLSIFEDRQRELEAELAGGGLDQKQYDSLLLELKKTLLTDTGKPVGEATTAKQPKKQTPSKEPALMVKAVPLVIVLMIPLVAYFLYGQWGHLNDIELMDLYERTGAAGDDQEEIRNLVVQLGAVVREDEENEWAWYFLGRNFSNMGMYTEAEVAFQRASDLMPEGADKAATLGIYAQIKYVLSGGELTDEVQAILDRAMAINPSNFTSLQLLSINAETTGDYKSAIGYWRLMIQGNPNSSMARELRGQIAEAQQLLAQAGGDGASAGPRIEVSIQLAEGLELPAELRVFISARNAEREGMPPLAAFDLLVRDLPATITLDDNLAVGPFNLSSASTVYVTAAVSRSGSATVQSGDYRVVSESFSLAGEQTTRELVISDIVP